MLWGSTSERYQCLEAVLVALNLLMIKSHVRLKKRKTKRVLVTPQIAAMQAIRLLMHPNIYAKETGKLLALLKLVSSSLILQRIEKICLKSYSEPSLCFYCYFLASFKFSLIFSIVTQTWAQSTRDSEKMAMWLPLTMKWTMSNCWKRMAWLIYL